MNEVPYRKGILSEPLDLDGDAPRRRSHPVIDAEPGLEVEVRGTPLFGIVVACDSATVTIRDRQGRDHTVRLRPGAFDVHGRQVTLRRPTSPGPTARNLTASGSVATPTAPARMARASRILVEGVHDAELIEKVWGDDLREVGVVVEVLHGADRLTEIVRTFGPGPGRRLGVLLDHLVDRSKESRLAAEIDHPDVLVTGHPFVDVWAAVRPSVIGLDAWPEIPPGQPWKEGVCAALGVDEPRTLWVRILRSIRSYADLDPTIVGAVERLIDFVTEPT